MDKFNIADERIALYRLQKNRVEMDANIEKALRKTFPTLNQDVRLLKELLDDLETAQGKSGRIDHGRSFKAV